MPTVTAGLVLDTRTEFHRFERGTVLWIMERVRRGAGKKIMKLESRCIGALSHHADKERLERPVFSNN